MKKLLVMLIVLLAGNAAGFSQEWNEENFTETVEEWNVPASLVEPPIYSLYTSTQVNLKDQQSVVLNEFMLSDASITTLEGRKLFKAENDGLKVNEPGLYRVSFSQRVGTLNSACEIQITLDRITPTSLSNLRRQQINLGVKEGDVIQFTQLVRMNAGDKFRLTIQPYKGEAGLLNGINASNFTVEAIR